MKYDPYKIMHDQQAGINATKLYDEVERLIFSDTPTQEIVRTIRAKGFDNTVILDTINMALGNLISTGLDQPTKVKNRGIVDILSMLLAGVE